jgi:Domain of unknown function (DUF4268)
MSEVVLPKLARLTNVPLRQVWNDEARIFTPWLELPENLDLLAEALGLPNLQQKSREHAVGRYAADLVCQIADTNEYLLIENQIEISDHKHLGQLLTYIAGLEAQDLRIRYVAWLAEDFRDEHRAAIEWLNERLDERIGFFAARIEVWKIGSTEELAPRFDVVVEPRQIATVAARAARPSEQSEVDISRVEYWRGFSEELRRRGAPLKIREEPPRLGFYTFTLDSRRGIYLYAYREVASQMIGSYISMTGLVARRVFEIWQSDKTAIETAFGVTLIWHEVQHDKNYRIQVTAIPADPLNEADWSRQHNWLADQVERLHRVFEPKVRALPTFEELAKQSAEASSSE